MDISFYNKKLLNYSESFEENYVSDISQALDLLEAMGNKIELPHSKSLGKGLFELRCLGTGIRIIYMFYNQEVVILHIIVKKQDKIPKKDLDLAKWRQSQFA
jgi:phage-related protein